MIKTVDRTGFKAAVLESGRPVLVDFWAEWCAPCRMLAPILEELAAEYDAVDIVKVNVDESPDLVAEYKVTAIPTIYIFKDGKAAERLVGLLSHQELEETLNRILGGDDDVGASEQ